MKVFVSAIFVLAVFGNAYAVPVDSSSQDDWNMENLHQLKKDVFTRAEQLIEEGLTEMGEEYCKEENIDLKDPLRVVYQRAHAVDIESETVCAVIKDNIEHVFEPLTSTIDRCGQASRLGPVAASSIKTLKSIIAYFCTITGEQILELVNPCIDDIDIENTQCAKEFKEDFDALSPENTTGDFVEEICRLLPKGRNCLLEQIGNKCRLDITKNTWTGLIDAGMVACH